MNKAEVARVSPPGFHGADNRACRQFTLAKYPCVTKYQFLVENCKVGLRVSGTLLGFPPFPKERKKIQFSLAIERAGILFGSVGVKSHLKRVENGAVGSL